MKGYPYHISGLAIFQDLQQPQMFSCITVQIWIAFPNIRKKSPDFQLLLTSSKLENNPESQDFFPIVYLVTPIVYLVTMVFNEEGFLCPSTFHTKNGIPFVSQGSLILIFNIQILGLVLQTVKFQVYFYRLWIQQRRISYSLIDSEKSEGIVEKLCTVVVSFNSMLYKYLRLSHATSLKSLSKL